MLTLATGDTLSASADTAAALSITVNVMELSGTTEVYREVQGTVGLTPATVYTVPASTMALVRAIQVANVTGSAVANLRVFTKGTAAVNRIVSVTVPANGSATFDGTGWKMYDAAGQQLYVGSIGPTGLTGEKGWSPLLAVVVDSARRVFQIVDWVGGAGTKPSTTNQFIGAAGIVGTAAAAQDIRGPQGAGDVSSTRILTAGAGLTGGGDLSADRTFDVNPDNSSIEVVSDQVRLKTDGTTNTHLAPMPAQTIKGNNTAATAGPTNLTGAQVATLLEPLRGAGAVGDGTANDRPAFVALDSSLPANYGIALGAGRYRIGSNLTITRRLDFSSGARIVVPTGVTITISAPVNAGIEQIFELEGTGSVVLSVYYNVERYVEWWGGVVGADCSPAFAQCVVAGSVTKLQARDYVTSATIMVPAAATIEGSGYNWEGDGTATRVLLASASVTPIVQLGSTATPIDLNSAPADPSIFDIYFTRNQAPNAGTVGCLVAWSRFARVERVRVNTNITDFRITNAVSPFITDTFAKRDIAIAAGQGTDSFVGYHIDGTGALPAAGGNASVWMTRPQTELNVVIANSKGYYVNGRFTDVFISQPETLGTNYGIDVLGDKAGAPAVGSNANLVIENPVVDQTKTIGIRIQDVNKWGAVKILAPYCGPATGDAVTCTNCDGHVGIEGGQMRMNVSTAGKGLTFDGCRSPTVQNTHIAECTTQALVLNNVTGGQFQPIIQNVTATCSAAVQSVAGVTKTTIRPSINGDPNKVSIAHQSLATSNQKNFVSLAGVATGVVVTPLSYTAGAEVGTTYPESTLVTARKTANQAMTATAATAITDMSVALDANASYAIELCINVGAVTGTTPTIAFSLTGPASPTVVSLKRVQMITATTEAVSAVTSFAAFAAGAIVANTVHYIRGTVVNGPNAGTLQLLAAMAGTTPNATILQGSNIVATRTSVT